MEDPSSKFKALEAHIKELEISQRRRRLGRSNDALERYKSPKLPSVQPHTGKPHRPKTAPASKTVKRKQKGKNTKTNGNNNDGGENDNRTPQQKEEDDILERFSATRRRREADQRFQSRQAELNERKLRLKQQFSSVKAREILLNKKLKHFEQRLFNLKGQDDIRQSRDDMGIKIRHEQDRLQHVQEKISELRSYSKTLQLMERRLWDEQITHVKTLETYYGALETHKLEVVDTEVLARNMRVARLETEAQLNEVNELIAQRNLEMDRRMSELQFAHRQREEYAREMQAKTRDLQMQVKKDEERQKEEAVTEQLSQIKKLKRMQTLTENLEKHEAAFRKIQMASGLNTAEEIIHNYKNRESILRNVKQKVDMLQAQLTKAQERHDRAKMDLNAEKYEATPGRDVPNKVKLRAMAANLRPSKSGNDKQEAPKSDIEEMAFKLKEAQTESRRVTVENRAIQSLIIKMAQSVRLLHGFLNLGEANASDPVGVNDDSEIGKKKKQTKPPSMLSPPLMLSSMQEIENKVMGLLDRLLKEKLPESEAYQVDVEAHLNAMASSKLNNIRVVRDRDAAVLERDKAAAQQQAEDAELRRYRSNMLAGDAELKDMRNRVKLARMRARALRSNKSLADVEAEVVSSNDVDISEELIDRSALKQSAESLSSKRKRKARRSAALTDSPKKGGVRRARSGRGRKVKAS